LATLRRTDLRLALAFLREVRFLEAGRFAMGSLRVGVNRRRVYIKDSKYPES
jgi:hypothetical protein